MLVASPRRQCRGCSISSTPRDCMLAVSSVQALATQFTRHTTFRTMARAISRSCQVFSAALDHASDAPLTLFASRINARLGTGPCRSLTPALGSRPVGRCPSPRYLPGTNFCLQFRSLAINERSHHEFHLQLPRHFGWRCGEFSYIVILFPPSKLRHSRY